MSDHHLTLYYFPGSFWSQTVLFALIERDIPYKQCIVNIHAGENREDWYLRINPKGEVPVLRDGNDIIVESDDIIDYLDTICQSEGTLVPDVNTSHGQEVETFRKLVRDSPNGPVTFGVMVNPELCECEMRFPKVFTNRITKENMVKKINGLRAALEAQMKREPESRKILQTKYEKQAVFRDIIIDPDRVATVLQVFDQTFDKLEEQLVKSKKGAYDTDNYWLCGTTLTAADISVAIMLFRTYNLGIDERYFSSEKRPLVMDYFRRLRALPTMQKVIAIADTVPQVYRRTMMKRLAIKTVKIGLVVGVVALGLWGYKEYKRAAGGLRKV